MIVGVDEVGRGAIAGDLLVCAVGFADPGVLERLSSAGCELLDSKAFSSRARRERSFEILTSAEGVRYCLARRGPREIEDRGIHLSVLDAMQEAARGVSCPSGGTMEYIFDGKFVPEGMKGEEARAEVKGDARFPEISAASIIAKVTRDREMVILGRSHPQYGFEKHAGYGTKVHIEAIAEFGLIDAHRDWARKFLKNVREGLDASL